MIASPPYPDHHSGYNCLSGAFMHTALDYLGEEQGRVQPGQDHGRPPDVTRTYKRFTDVIKDTIDPRIWLGIHFRTPDVQGAELGEDVADLLDRRYFDER